MEQEIHYKETNVIAKFAFISWMLGVGSVILFFLSCAIRIDSGIFVLLMIIFFISSFVLGCISLGVFVIRHNSVKGLTWAILSILLSSVPIYVFFSIWLGVQARMQREKEYTGIYNLKLLGGELVKYAGDNNGYLPDANKWCDLLLEHNKNLTKDNFKHPLHKDVSKKDFKLSLYPFPDAFNFTGDCQFAFNKKLGGMRLADVPSDVILLFEADGPWNMNGGSELLKTRYREKGNIHLLSVDGTESTYWFYKDAVQKFKSESGGRVSMYYEQPRWDP